MNKPSAIATDARSLPLQINRELFAIKGVTWRAILAYNALVYFAGSGKVRDASVAHMAELVNVSESSLRRGLRELERLKLIRTQPRERHRKGKSSLMPNDYTLLDLTPNHHRI